MKLVLQIAAGVLLAGLIGWITSGLITAAAIKTASDAMTTSIRHSQEQSKQQLEASRRLAEQRRAERQARDQQRAREAAEADRATAAADLASARAEHAKASAWARFYQAPPECEHPPTWEFQVECGNKNIRAKRDFEVRWERGELN